jgi:serine/threonine protein kinase
MPAIARKKYQIRDRKTPSQRKRNRENKRASRKRAKASKQAAAKIDVALRDKIMICNALAEYIESKVQGPDRRPLDHVAPPQSVSVPTVAPVAPWWTCFEADPDLGLPLVSRQPLFLPLTTNRGTVEKASSSFAGLRCVGEGTFGKVFLCNVKLVDTGILVPAAIKVAKPPGKKDLLIEEKALTILAGCKQVVNLLCAAGDGGFDQFLLTRRVLVLELVDCSLAELLERKMGKGAIWPTGPLAGQHRTSLLSSMTDVCLGVAFMHDRAGIAHNDLKPANIGVVMDGPHRANLKILDLGGASLASGEGRRSTGKKLRVNGCTPGYEAWERRKIDGTRPVDGEPWQWDLPSLGTVLMCLATRQPGIHRAARRVKERMLIAHSQTRAAAAGLELSSKLWDNWRGQLDKTLPSFLASWEGKFGKELEGWVCEGVGQQVTEMILQLLSRDVSARPSAADCVKVLRAAATPKPYSGFMF